MDICGQEWSAKINFRTPSPRSSSYQRLLFSPRYLLLQKKSKRNKQNTFSTLKVIFRDDDFKIGLEFTLEIEQSFGDARGFLIFHLYGNQFPMNIRYKIHFALSVSIVVDMRSGTVMPKLRKNSDFTKLSPESFSVQLLWAEAL